MWRKLVRPNIRAMQPYVSARLEHDAQDALFLDANENSLGSVGGSGLNRYPDPLQRNLKKRLADFKKVDAGRIFLGNGSDEAIDLLMRAFCEPGRDRILITPPTYGMYAVCARVNDVAVDAAPLNPDFSLNAERVLETAGPDTRMLILCSPNNPTANVLDYQLVEKLIRSFDGLVVIDEAYVDFAAANSWLARLGDFSNLVVLQTFSKAWGLAGARLGMAFADPGLIDVLNKIKYPYNVSALSCCAAEKALDHIPQYRKMLGQILQNRTALTADLQSLPFVREVFPSRTNFLLFRVQDAAGLYRFLQRKGIYVRDRSSQLHCADCLRVTVGSTDENEALIQSMKKFKTHV